MTERVGWFEGGKEKKKSTTWKGRRHVVDMLAKCGHRGGDGVKSLPVWQQRGGGKQRRHMIDSSA